MRFVYDVVSALFSTLIYVGGIVFMMRVYPNSATVSGWVTVAMLTGAIFMGIQISRVLNRQEDQK